MKVVINRTYGSFDLPYKAWMRFAELKGIKLTAYIPNREGILSRCDNVSEEDDGYVFYYRDMNKDILTFDDEGQFSPLDIDRKDPALVQIVEEFGEPYLGLKIVEIPDDVKWYLAESEEGIEWISEEHRTWQ